MRAAILVATIALLLPFAANGESKPEAPAFGPTDTGTTGKKPASLAPKGNGGIQDAQAVQDLADSKKTPPPPTGALEVTATGTLEWLREDQMYVARQNAVARHNDTTLMGNVLVAHYQVPQGKKSGMEIVQVTADGNPVKLISATAVAYGQHGVYDLPKHLILLLGDNLKLVTTDEVVTAKDSLEYYEDIDTGVARGDAVMLRADDKLTADVIAAKFVHQSHGGTGAAAAPAKAPPPQPGDDAPDKPKTHSLERLDAKGHVVLVTPTDIVHGDEAVYNPITDQTTVIGNVHVTREENQLDGSRAEVDMTTGISRVYAAPDAKVHGLFLPKKKDKKDKDAGDAPDGEATAAPVDDAGGAR